MNIFDKQILNEEVRADRKFIHMGQYTLKKNWLKDNPIYHSLVLTAIHLGELKMSAQHLEKDKTENNIFKLTEVNREISNIVERNKIYEVKESNEQFVSGRYTIQKLGGIFNNNSYQRECLIQNGQIIIQSLKNKNKANTILKIQEYDFFLETKKQSLTNNLLDKKKNFVWLEQFPIRIFMKGENLRSYAIYIPKLVKGKQLFQYFKLQKLNRKFQTRQSLLNDIVVNWKKKIIVHFINKLNQFSVIKQEKKDQFLPVQFQQNEIRSQIFEDRSPTKQISITSNIKLNRDNLIDKTKEPRFKKSKEIEYNIADNDDQQIIKMIKKRNKFSYLKQQEILSNLVRMNTTSSQQQHKFNKMNREQEFFPIYQTTEVNKDLEIINNNEKFFQKEANQVVVLKQEQTDFVNLKNNFSYQLQQQYQQNKAPSSQIQKIYQLDKYLLVTEIEMYIKHFESQIRLQIIQLIQTQFESANMKYQKIISHEIQLIDQNKLIEKQNIERFKANQSSSKPIRFTNKFIPKFHKVYPVSSISDTFIYKFKFIKGNYQIKSKQIQFLKLKHQKVVNQYIYIKECPFTARIGVIISPNIISPYKQISTIECLQKFLLQQDYQLKYRFIENGKSKMQANNQFNKKVWIYIINNNEQKLIERQMFLGVPKSLKNKFIEVFINQFRISQKNTKIVNYNSMQQPFQDQTNNIYKINVLKQERLTLHQKKILKQSLSSDYLQELQTKANVQGIINKILEFKCNNHLKERLDIIFMYFYYKYGSIKNLIFIIVHEIMEKLKPLFFKMHSNEECLQLIDLYYEMEYQIDQLMKTVFNYL